MSLRTETGADRATVGDVADGRLEAVEYSHEHVLVARTTSTGRDDVAVAHLARPTDARETRCDSRGEPVPKPTHRVRQLPVCKDCLGVTEPPQVSFRSAQIYARLAAAGYDQEALADATVEELAAVDGVGEQSAREVLKEVTHR